MVDEKQYITQEKFDDLTKELDQLKTVKRREVAEQLEHARSLGDLSENAEYHEARDEQGKVEDRIAQIEFILKHAEIVSTHHSDVVEIGTVVMIAKKGDKTKREITLVGPEEADMASGKVSYQSPLGQAIMGKKVKEEFVFSTPAGEAAYVVVEIK